MSRNRMIATAVLLWTTLAIDLGLHVATNELIALPLTGVGFVAWVTISRLRRRATAVPVRIDGSR